MKDLKQIFQNRRIYAIMSYTLPAAAVFVLTAALIPVGNPYTKASGDVVVSHMTDIKESAEIGSMTSKVSVSTEPATFAVLTKTFVRNGNESVAFLMENYCEALVGGNENLLAKYTDSVEGIDGLIRKIYSEYVEEITDINCYVMSGMLDKTYITMTTYNVKYKGQQTLLPYAMYCYVCTDASGNLYVSNKEPGEDVSSYNNMMYKNSSISDIVSNVAAEYDRKLETDSELASFIAEFSQQ